MNSELFFEHPTVCVFWVLVLIAWDLAWKLIALWRAAQKRQYVWFICIGVLNTVGILPITYLLTHRKQ